STSGTISLNIALMKLPEQLSDYVILHELAHTKHMNHGAEFWAELESTYPNAKQARNQLKNHSPYL
ncbi:MAG: M48 family metallopeptidase, partial [Candidatus Saccharibacteria bacterium]|nr:M48 family metallopeptidase [Candidatus Saccharibacteria bacterium]